MFQTLKNIVKKVYLITLMGFVVWYGFFITPLILGYNERKEALIEESKKVFATEEERSFQKFLKEQSETVTMDLGYKLIKEQYVKGHFHHVGFHVEHDSQSLCIKCHGDVPHDKAKAIRAFLNMHAFYLGCETCHIKPKEGHETWIFKWYDKKTGNVIPNPPELAATNVEKYGNYNAKISPGIIENGKFIFLNGDKERAFVGEYLKNKDKLSPPQQSMMKKIIHRQVNEHPFLCDECHTTENPYLPFEKLGYPSHRISGLTNTEVVGIAKRYKEFYLPKFLLTDMVDTQPMGNTTPNRGKGE